MNIQMLIAAFAVGTTLSGCKEDAVDTSTATQSKSPAGDHLTIAIGGSETRGNASNPSAGFGCSIQISMENNSDKEVSLVQILKYIVVSSSGELVDNGSNFRLGPNETTDRAGLYFSGTSCDDVESVTFDEITCFYQGGMNSNDLTLRCSDKLHLVNETDMNVILPQTGG